MANYKETDLLFIEEQSNGIIDGDLIVKNGDLALTGEYECVRQELIMRSRTNQGELRTHPQYGSNLEDFIGQPNTAVTASNAALDLFSAFTYDGRFSEGDITIRPVPTSITEMHFYVFLRVGLKRVVIVNIPIELG